MHFTKINIETRMYHMGTIFIFTIVCCKFDVIRYTLVIFKIKVLAMFSFLSDNFSVFVSYKPENGLDLLVKNHFIYS